MNNKKTSSWNLGVKGYIIVILAFFSCYVYSALTSDSLNVTRDVLSVLVSTRQRFTQCQQSQYRSVSSVVSFSVV